MACSLSLVPLQHRSLAGQEHGRTIPLTDVNCRPPLAVTPFGETYSAMLDYLSQKGGQIDGRT